MNPQQMPVGNQPEFKEEALNAKFSYAFTRKQLIILVNVLRPLQFSLQDIRGRILSDVLDEIERTAIQSLTSNDYKKPVDPVKASLETPPVAPVQTN